MTTESIANLLKSARVGDLAPDAPVFHLTRKVSTTLLSSASPGRPLVLNFGSCS